jgi:3-oxoacyl-[acyl-carrier-protein] synthase-1
MSLDQTRVVITGMGVVAPNGTGISNYLHALKNGISGIKYREDLKELKFGCQIAGTPVVTDEYKQELLPELIAKKVENSGVIYGCLAGIEAFKDAGFEIDPERYDPDTGIVFGAGALGLDSFVGEKINMIDNGNTRRLGTWSSTQSMNSGASAYLNQILGFGNRIICNSSACSSGTEAVILGYEYIKSGKAKRMLCGSSEGEGRYIWGAFDALRVLCRDSNDNPTGGSRPLSSSSAGFVPAAGSGALMIESLESAMERGAKIYAEIVGTGLNSGGQRNGGTMTAPNSQAVQACIKSAVNEAGIDPQEIDLVSGHLTSTMADPLEIKNWSEALGRSGCNFPYVNSTKSMIGHSIAGAGSVEIVASLLQMNNGFIHPTINCGEVHPSVENLICAQKISTESRNVEVNTVIKANFGFGDVNSAIVLRKLEV